jgi:tol-pal system protein YbgF
MKVIVMRFIQRLGAAACLASAFLVPVAAHAGIFDDNQARQAILDLRKQLEQINEGQRVKQAELNAQMTEELTQLRRSMLELNNQLEAMRGDFARMQGVEEQLMRDVADLQRRQKDTSQGIDDRLRRMEPQKVMLEGQEVAVDPEEKRLYDGALGQLRSGDFPGAVVSLLTFQRRYPVSPYTDTVRFWLGNAHYGKREYKEAIASFRGLVTAAPTHTRAAEALLAIANCQAEMKDIKTARRTVEELIRSYPNSEAAQAGKERLATLK